MLRAGLAVLMVPLAMATVAGAGWAQTAPKPDAPQKKERRTCRDMSEPGRLAGRRRVCMTRTEWERAAETARRTGEAMIGVSDSCTLRGNGGAAPSGDFQQDMAAAQQRLAGC